MFWKSLFMAVLGFIFLHLTCVTVPALKTLLVAEFLDDVFVNDSAVAQVIGTALEMGASDMVLRVLSEALDDTKGVDRAKAFRISKDQSEDHLSASVASRIPAETLLHNSFNH
ncbi:hypothetical protein RUND412_001371 [Rhizina undulata]